ncbi:hypothetical protein LPB90_10615 [Chryseobacterium sp. LC2016-29]|uniref:hypothetical protein n=1 Tax=Chryseobacterium sp. LC2016-29 TaxID=2897331 RepID=UPI001E34BC66|nr:hypothetical protein [Chryseobacterium sp. LC2016-29]MCD0478912.1 hypothetical protein [Chryseobacterium sp. LC2016-29]
MQTNKILLLNILLFLLIGCKKSVRTQNTANTFDTSKVKKAEILKDKTKYKENVQNKSFVISCGTECAMTYTAEQITKNKSSFKVKFNVDMYTNEEISDSYKETYSFIYDESNNIDKIILEGANRNALETLPIGAKESFVEFSKLLLKPVISSNENYFKFSNSILPYQKKIDINKIIYKSMSVSSINGLSEFACGEEKIRYILLDKTEKIIVILIPFDCGDIPYRYYLITIYNNSVISNLYVEGELYEPESNNAPEKTNFTIDKNSILTVKISNKNFEIGIDEEKKYQISNTGKIIEIK